MTRIRNQAVVLLVIWALAPRPARAESDRRSLILGLLGRSHDLPAGFIYDPVTYGF